MSCALPFFSIYMNCLLRKTLLFHSTGQWRQCCDDVMKIELPSPRKPAPITPKQGSLYHEMGMSGIMGVQTDLLCLIYKRQSKKESTVVACDCVHFPLQNFQLTLLYYLCSVDRRGLNYDSLTQISVLFLSFLPLLISPFVFLFAVLSFLLP